MRVKIAPNDNQSMSQDGDAILRSLQNKNLGTVDLMVRESLQNSLDATLENSKVTDVEFKIGNFICEDLAPHFEMISDKLIEKFPGEQSFLAISDRNTSGLTGDFKSNDSKLLNASNFQKLIFGIGKNQEQEGAGGSWGIGKTSYFRIGEGIVLYYTRIAVGNGYEERLIASLIESPKQDNRLFKKSERGIAWWGEFGDDKDKLFPITDHACIKEILELFGLENYDSGETGTTILVPYLKPIDSGNFGDENSDYPWEINYSDAISMAVQRWYCPRIWNDKYSEKINNSQLHCKVNGVGIHPQLNMEPTFKIFQELYTSALLGKAMTTDINVEKITFPRAIMKNTDEAIGYVAFCEVDRKKLSMIEPDNKKSGLAYIGIKDKAKIEKNISKVVAYARKPGMVVEYDVDGDWAPRGLIQKEDHLLFGFFVPNSTGELLEKFKYDTLEQYLRATENADHAKWVDDVGIGIIRRMKSYTAKAINEAFQNLTGNDHTTETSALSRKFGALLMPPKNFGKTSAKKGSDNNDKNKRHIDSRNRNSDIHVTESIPIDGENVNLSFKAFIKRKSKSTIFIQVLTQDQKMDKVAWNKTMGNTIEFPIKIDSVFLKSIDEHEINCSIDEYDSPDLEVSFKKDQTGILEVVSKVTTGIEIEGIMKLKILSNQYLPSVAIRSDININEGEK